MKERTLPSERSLRHQEKISGIMNNLEDFVVTNPSPDSLPERLNPSPEACRKATVTLRNILFKTSVNKKYGQDKDLVLEHGRRGLQDMAGVCDTCAAVILYLIAKIPNWSLAVELMGDGHHAFLAVNRRKKSNPDDPREWGPDSFIIDFWDKQVFGNKGIISGYWEKINYKATLIGEHIKIRTSWTAKEIQESGLSIASTSKLKESPS